MYDLLILGGGPAGYYAAERAAEAGFHTLLFEERSLGGTCLNEGCIPTKSLLYAAKIADLAKKGKDYGVLVEGIRLDHKKALVRKNMVVQKLVAGVGASLKQHKIDVVPAYGVIRGRIENGFSVEAKGEVYEGSRLLICTGSEPVIPPIKNLEQAIEEGFALTSRELLDLDTVPERLAIVGGGAIGLEFANYFAAAGSEVSVIEMLPEIGGAIDADVAKALRTELENHGVQFMLESRMTEAVSGGVRVKSAKGEEIVGADKVLLSIGRRPRTEGAGLEELGVYMEKGAVITDAHMRTNLPGVWAAGDVNGKLMLAHTAYREAAVAIGDMKDGGDSMRYNAVPQVIYTSPEVACVGETEQSAEEKGFVFDKIVLPLQYSGRYLAENARGAGFIKLLAERSTGCIMGVHIIGSYASEIIVSAAMMVGSKMTKEAAKKIIFPHPTVGEVIRDALNGLN